MDGDAAEGNNTLPAELLTRTEFNTEIARLGRLEDRFDWVDRKIDRVLLAVVGGMFVIVAAIITTGTLT